MNEFYEYLMLEMADEINGQWEEESDRAHELCFLLSVDGKVIPETFWNFYVAGVGAPHENLTNAAAFFSGMGLLTIDCDCESEWKTSCAIHNIRESEFYESGENCMMNEQDVWLELIKRVVDVREAFGVGEPI